MKRKCFIKNRFIIFCFYIFLSTINYSQDARLIVNIKGLSSTQGHVNIRLFDNPNNFPDMEFGLTGARIKIDSSEVTYEFNQLKNGFYAIAVFHDENSNNEFDYNFLGMPIEDYVFSNYAKGFFSAPSFESAKFELIDSLMIELFINK